MYYGQHFKNNDIISSCHSLKKLILQLFILILLFSDVRVVWNLIFFIALIPYIDA